MSFNITNTRATAITTLKRKDKKAGCFKITIQCLHCFRSYEVKFKSLKTMNCCKECGSKLTIGAHIKRDNIPEQIAFIDKELHMWRNIPWLHQKRIRKLHSWSSALKNLHITGTPQIKPK